MNEDIKRLTKTIIEKVDHLNLLEISGKRWRVTGNNTKYRSLNYPDFDICSDKVKDKYNLIIAEMVFEHLSYPYKAGKNIYEMLEQGGYFIISVPFMYPIHNHPIDCCRWSKQGLKFFLNECGFNMDKVVTDSWGNKECVQAICENKNHIVIYDGSQSLINEENFPVSVWGMAQK